LTFEKFQFLHFFGRTHESTVADDYKIPVDLTQWLSDCNCEIQNFTQLIEKEIHKYKNLRYPPSTTTPEEGVDATRPFEEPKETPDIQGDLHTIRAKITYLMRKRQHLKELLDCVIEIKRKHISTSPSRTDKTGKFPRSNSTASVLSSIPGPRSFEETNKELVDSMLGWLRSKGLFIQQPRDPVEVVKQRQDSTDTLSVSSMSEDHDADPAPAVLSDPFLTLLGPNALAEQCCVIPLQRGYTIVRVSRSSPAEDALLRLRSVEIALSSLDRPAADRQLMEPPSPIILPPLARRNSVDSSLSHSHKSDGKKSRRVKEGKSKRSRSQAESGDDDSLVSALDDDFSYVSEPAAHEPAATEAEMTSVPLDPRAQLSSRGEEQNFQEQLQQLTRCGVLPAPVLEEAPTASSDLLSITSSGINKLSATSAIAARIQRSRERQKQAQQAADRRSAAAKAAEDTVSSLTLHCPDGLNPFAAVLRDLRLLGVFVQRFDQVRLVPAVWHLTLPNSQAQLDQPAILTLNGQSLDHRMDRNKAEDGVELVDGDVLQVGVFIFLRVHIPRKTKPAAASGLSFYLLVFLL